MYACTQYTQPTPKKCTHIRKTPLGVGVPGLPIRYYKEMCNNSAQSRTTMSA